MTQKAPERIWAWYIRTQDGKWLAKHCAQEERPNHPGARQYVHIDHALALVAAEREACAELATIEAENFAYAAGKDWRSPGSLHDRGRQECGYKISSTIRARSDADAQDALEDRGQRIKQEAWNAALREAIDAVHHECWTDGNQNQVTPELLAEQATTSLAIGAIKALITEDQSD